MRQYAKFCVLNGLLENGDVGGPMAVLPEHCRPELKLQFAVTNNENTMLLSVLPNGALIHDGGSKAHGWTNLNGVIINMKFGQAVDLAQWLDEL